MLTHINTSSPFKSIGRFYSEAAATTPKYTFEFSVREKRKLQISRQTIAKKGEKQARKRRLPSVGLTLNKKAQERNRLNLTANLEPRCPPL